ncbi:hypothetical protein [Methylobacterium sp. J-076]|uniref:hypothetical protein n=1 Tax=Methylobacterium sp. J-076 TaxID=2836655 RepID=UPI001FB969F0|nr:hypothetical protein [Methylobacterium sp. J-076]MCJ2014740.1 hypothetical protein [Methylobacterium sp. J-076]
MKNHIVAMITVLILGAGSISPTVAYENSARPGYTPFDVEATGSLDGFPGGRYDRNPRTCPQNSAAEGNANQQNFPVKQYGQTTGGNRC